MFPNYKAQGKGRKHKVRAGPGARAPCCGQKEAFGAMEGSQGKAGYARIWSPVRLEGKDSWEEYPPTITGWGQGELANLSWDDQGQEHSGGRGLPA